MTQRRLTDAEQAELAALTAAVAAAIAARRDWLDTKMAECSSLQVGDDIYDLRAGRRLGKITRLYRYWRDRDDGVRDVHLDTEYEYETAPGCRDNTSRQARRFVWVAQGCDRRPGAAGRRADGVVRLATGHIAAIDDHGIRVEFDCGLMNGMSFCTASPDELTRIANEDSPWDAPEGGRKHIMENRQHPTHPPRELALQLAVSIANGSETPETTVDRAERYAAFLSK